MKTSLIIDDRLFREARKEAQKTGKTLSEMISHWARIGWETLRKSRSRPTKGEFKAVNLGGPSKIDLRSRRDWMDTLDE